MSRHIIHTQKVTLNLPKREEAYAIQNRVSALLHNELSASMETVFDELFPAGDIIRIDSLKLDLGSIDPRNFEQEFKEHFIQELRKNLSSKKDTLNHSDNEEILSNAQSQIKALIYFLENGYLPWYSSVESITDWGEEIIACFSDKKDRYFFGWLADNYNNNPVVLQRLIAQFKDSFLEKLLLATTPPTDVPWGLIYSDLMVLMNNCIKEVGAFRNEVWKYLFHSILCESVFQNNYSLTEIQHSQLVFHSLKSLTDHFGIQNADITMSAVANINKQLKTSIVKNAFHELKLFLKTQDSQNQKVKSKDHNDLVATSKTGGTDDPTRIEVRSDDAVKNTMTENQESEISDQILDKGSDETAYNQGNTETPNNGEEYADNNATGNKTGLPGNDADKRENGAVKQEKVNELADKKMKAGIPAQGVNESKSSGDVAELNKKPDPIPEKQSFYIQNSGIVILHYFLNPFFDDLKLLTDGKFKDDTTHQRAVLLLHYLATGNTEVAEFDLTLQKILCGYPLNETLPAAIILTKKEKAESKKLLEAVTDHWTPMKNTTAEGLRDAFLKRDGKLIKKENGWLLTVEQRTLDVLLDKLPWGFSTIRLPWMQQILNVDWY